MKDSQNKGGAQSSSAIARLASKILKEFDSAVSYSFLQKILQFVLGPIVLLAVTTQMSPVEQGFYFVFLSLLRLKGFVDLGLAQTSSQILAFSFSKLKYSDREGLTGPQDTKDEFLATAKFLAWFFKALSLIFLLLIGGGGYFFLARQDASNVTNWVGPWILLVGAASLTFSFGSGGLISRGCNLMSRFACVGFWVQLLGLVSFLAVLYVGGGLWASASMAVSQALGAIILFFRLGKPFHRQMKDADSSQFCYKEKLLPLQMKNAVTFGSGFLIFYSFTPLTMEFCGPVEAGKVGMNL